MVSTLKELIAVRANVFHAPWWVALALFVARVPCRVGVRSKIHSYLFFNRSLRQKRSRAEKHEAEYGLQLVSAALGQAFDFNKLDPLRLGTPLSVKELQNLGIAQDYIVVHPGMAGSALNWPSAQYIEFIDYFSKTCDIVVTCGPSDQQFVTPISAAFSGNNKVKSLAGLNFAQLILVLQTSKGVLAPSTGVLHMAASLGVPTLGIYSPIGVERAIRWGPRGANVETLTPETKNNSFDPASVMGTLDVGRVINKFKEML